MDYVTKPVKPFLLKARVKTHIELKRKNDELKRLSRLDGLAGIVNRRSLDEFLDMEWKRALRRGNSSLSVILLDVDYFKRYNDGYGHQAGDECLRKVASTLQNCENRSTDLVARYGGEEFIYVLPETSLEGAIHQAEKIKKSLEAQGIPNEFSDVSKFLTLSMAIANIIPSKEFSVKGLIETADQKLYLAKKEGRNQFKYEQKKVGGSYDLTI